MSTNLTAGDVLHHHTATIELSARTVRPRFYRCRPCDVTWFDTTAVCWCCDGTDTERWFPIVHRDLSGPQSGTGCATGAPYAGDPERAAA